MADYSQLEHGSEDVRTGSISHYGTAGGGTGLGSGSGSSNDKDTPYPGAKWPVAYSLWAVLGFATGAHWLYLRLHVKQYSRKYGLWCLFHCIAYPVAFISFWLFRAPLSGWSVPCRGGETMSVSCLFHEQTERYRAFYIIHIIIMLFFFSHWFVDCGVMWRWCIESKHGRKPKGLGTWLLPCVLFITGMIIISFLLVNIRQL